MYALASNVTGAGSVESRPARPAKYAAAAGKPPPYSVSSPARTSSRSPRVGGAGGAAAAAGTARRRGAAPSAREGGERVVDAPGDGVESLAGRRPGIGHDDRAAGVGETGELRLQRHLAQQRDDELVGEPHAAAGEEDLRALAAVGAHEVAHVLDHAQHRH